MFSPTVFQSSDRSRPAIGPLTAADPAIYIPMSGGSELIANPHAAQHDHNEWINIDPEKVTQWMIARGIDSNYDGIVFFDYEPYVKYEGEWYDTLPAYQTIYNSAKMHAPNAIVGFFGPPGVRHTRDGERDYQFDLEYFEPYFEIPDILLVQNYIASGRPLRLNRGNADRVGRQVELAMQSGLPWISALSFRIHVGRERDWMPPAVQEDLVRHILYVNREDPALMGFMQWGWTGRDAGHPSIPERDEHFVSLLEAIRNGIEAGPQNAGSSVTVEDADRDAPSDEDEEGDLASSGTPAASDDRDSGSFTNMATGNGLDG